MRGKATGSSCVKLNSQDHPRVCGEKPERKAPRRPRLGSPPRMRGKETDSRRQCCSAGITPAYAGKRTLFCLAGRRNRDHPRVCGEKCSDHIDKGMIEGSPPRMRGKGQNRRTRCRAARITPAYAGKRRLSYRQCRTDRDHPRVCGEKWVIVLALILAAGSPPRMRGKGPNKLSALFNQGITPAYAGKRLKRSRSTVPPVAIVPLFPSVCNKPVVSDGSPAGRDAPLFLPAENAVPASPAYNLRSL